MRDDEFLEYVQSGGQVETDDWMPDEYRARLRKFIEMHGNSELMGVLPEREWILRAPTLQRKLALTAKVQEEPGHRRSTPAVPRRLRAADLGARAHRPGPGAPQGRGDRPLALHRGRLGRAHARRHRARADDRRPARPATSGARELGLGPVGSA